MTGFKYITAAEAGLVKWDNFKQPPYTQTEYEQAYNNGVNLTSAINAAYEAGAALVILERGDYPVCYNAPYTAFKNAIPDVVVIDGPEHFEVNGNGSNLFVIFDSNNRNPYDLVTNADPYKLQGCVIKTRNTYKVKVHGFELRGDQYNRTWVTGESQMEQTYGVWIAENCIDTDIDVVAHGFRGDSVSGQARGTWVFDFKEGWAKGDINPVTGAAISTDGARTSGKLDLLDKNIKRNAVQIMSTGYLRQAYFRDHNLLVAFYDTDQNFIMSERTGQAEFIYLPKNCRYIQFVAYKDERTEDTASYAPDIGQYLGLFTGCSDRIKVSGEFYANNRGGVSNICNNSTIDAYIRDIGTIKYGFKPYSSTTIYGVNFEDTWVTKLSVTGRIENVGSGVLANCKELNVDNCTIRNAKYTAVSTFNTITSKITNCSVDNAGNFVGYRKFGENFNRLRTVTVSGNTVRNASQYNLSDSLTDSLIVDFGNNKFINTSVNIISSLDTTKFSNNYVSTSAAPFVSALGLRGVDDLSNNIFIINEIDGNAYSQLNVVDCRAENNKLSITRDTIKMSRDINMEGFEFEAAIPTDYSVIEMSGFSEGTERGYHDITFTDSELHNVSLRFTRIGSTTNVNRLNATFTRCTITNNKAVNFISWNINEAADLDDIAHRITFNNCHFDLTALNSVVYESLQVNNKLIIGFNECTFESDVGKVMPIVRKRFDTTSTIIEATAYKPIFKNIELGR